MVECTIEMIGATYHVKAWTNGRLTLVFNTVYKDVAENFMDSITCRG